MVSPVMKELLPFDCLILVNLSVLNHNLVSNGWNFMELILSIYDHCVIMHVKFCQGVH